MEIVNNYENKGKLIRGYEVSISVSEFLDLKKEKSDILIFKSNKRYKDKELLSDISTEFDIVLTYPLSVTVKEHLTNIQTLGELLYETAQVYKKIYEIEDDNQEIDTEEGLYNRSKTEGNFGIWGHYIGDLFFERVSIFENNIVEFHIGS